MVKHTVIHELNIENQKSISLWIHSVFIILWYISKSETIDLLVSTMRKFGVISNDFGMENFKKRWAAF